MAQEAVEVATAEWWRVLVSDYRLRDLRDRHYSGGVGGRTVGAPGERLAFVTFDGRAGWISHRSYWGLEERFGAGYVCSFFRNEGAGLASDLILSAMEATEEIWGPPPQWLTMVDPGKVRRKRDPGRCFIRAGYRPVGITKDKHLVVLARHGGRGCRSSDL